MECIHNWEDWEGGDSDCFRWYGKCKICGEMRCTSVEDGFPPDDVWEEM